MDWFEVLIPALFGAVGAAFGAVGGIILRPRLEAKEKTRQIALDLIGYMSVLDFERLEEDDVRRWSRDYRSLVFWAMHFAPGREVKARARQVFVNVDSVTRKAWAAYHARQSEHVEPSKIGELKDKYEPYLGEAYRAIRRLLEALGGQKGRTTQR